MTGKRKIINAYTPTVGDVAIMTVGFFGHVGIVQEINGEIITIKEANYKTGSITERQGTASELKIVGYFNPSPKPKKECWGADISHYQNQAGINWDKLQTDFLIIKATQGKSYVDPYLNLNKKMAREKGFALGYYHFANGGMPADEAKHFCKNVGWDLKKGEFIVLDWEINDKNPQGWCKVWSDYVEAELKVKPIIYTNEARVKSIDWTLIVNNNNGLWCAKYGVNNGKPNTPPVSGDWPFWMMWQYTSRGKVNGINGNVDLNYCKMDVKTLQKYGKK
jgi:GH25 family lysozyme M1 (1,4-beta-N-acetylmuramidase)